MECCIVCLDSTKPLVEDPSVDSFERLLERTRQRHEYKDSAVSEFFSRISDMTAQQLVQNKSKYHKKCYSNFANSSKVGRAKKRYSDSIETGQTSFIKPKIGRPTLVSENIETVGRTLRSKSDSYDKSCCILCQIPGGILHRVETQSTGKLMLSVAKSLIDKSFFLRLNTIQTPDDAVANDVVYHNLCWADAKKRSKNKVKPIENLSYTLSKIEVINYVKTSLQNKAVLDMNILNATYKEILIENGELHENLSNNYKKLLKDLIEDHIPSAVFVKSKYKNKPEQILSGDTQSEAVDLVAEDLTDESDVKAMWKVANKIRKQLLQNKWKFEGNMTSFNAPPLLSTFLKWMLIGPHGEKTGQDRALKVEQFTSIVTQLVLQSVKTEKQAKYYNKSGKNQYYSKKETPVNVGVGLYIYHSTRSRKLINFLSDLNISVSYDKVINIKKDIATAVLERRKDHNGVYVPSKFTYGNPVFFAIDNADLKIDTVDGKHQLHGTATAAYQQEDGQQENHVSILFL